MGPLFTLYNFYVIINIYRDRNSMKNFDQIGTIKPLDGEAYAVITGLQTTAGEPLVGPVARGGCMVAGEAACKAVCQLQALERGAADDSTVELAEAGLLDKATVLEEDPQACADENLASALDELGINPARALIVAVGMSKNANRVGYVDDADVQASMVSNPNGWFELTPATPYNAMYAKKGDLLPNGEPVELIGMRIGGNGIVVDVMNHEDGPVYGITHLTRTNMPGTGHEDEYDGKQQPYRTYVAQDSIDHYNADPTSVATHIISAVSPQTAAVRFSHPDLVDSVMPGWAADGLITNVTNPDWLPGMPLVNPATGEYDVLERDYPQQIRNQVHEAAKELGITDIRDDIVLDPGVPTNGIIHSSADRVRNAEDTGDYVGAVTDRDLYAVVFK
jgi:hypothetical protein